MGAMKEEHEICVEFEMKKWNVHELALAFDIRDPVIISDTTKTKMFKSKTGIKVRLRKG